MAWGFTKGFIKALRDAFEPGMLRLIAFGAVVGVGFLVAMDLAHSPVRHYPAAPLAAALAETAVAPAAALPTPPTAGDRSIAKAEANADRHRDLHDVTVFSRASVELAGRHLVAVTGLVYANASDGAAAPMRSFCYLQSEGRSPESQITVRLAAKDRDGRVTPGNLRQADAAAVDLPLEALRSAIGSCR
jgi:hypothetical protein